MNIEIFKVILGGIPPVLGVMRDVVHVVYYCHLAILRTKRAIEIVNVQPRASPVQHLAGMQLVPRLRGIRMVKIHIHRHANRLTKEDPRAVILPSTGGDGV